MYHTAIVGLSPSKLCQFTPEDMRALCEAFRELTGVDPLHDTTAPAAVWDAMKQGARVTMRDPKFDKLVGL
jgi:hypothetical protein